MRALVQRLITSGSIRPSAALDKRLAHCPPASSGVLCSCWVDRRMEGEPPQQRPLCTCEFGAKYGRPA